MLRLLLEFTLNIIHVEYSGLVLSYVAIIFSVNEYLQSHNTNQVAVSVVHLLLYVELLSHDTV